MISSTILSCIPTHAQIVPDNTLGSQGSRVTPNTLIQGVSSDLIDGGANVGCVKVITNFNQTEN